MLGRRRATVVVSANWWDGGRLEHLVVGPLGPTGQPVAQFTAKTPREARMHNQGSGLNTTIRMLP